MITDRMHRSPLHRPSARPAAATVEGRVTPAVRSMVRRGLGLYFVLVIFEGVLRKWLLPDLNQMIYLAKDTVLLLICLRVAVEIGYIPVPRMLRQSTVGQLLVAFAVYSCIQGFNPNLPSTLLGLWGIRTYLIPMSLVYLVPLGMPDTRLNERDLRRYLLIGIPMAVLCAIQYQSPPTHWINQYSNTTEVGESVALVADAVRVTGTFPYITGLGAYVAFQVAGLLGILMASGWKLRGNRLGWVALLSAVATIPMTGSRAVVVYFGLYLVIVFMLDRAVLKRAGASSRLLVAAVCVAAVSTVALDEAFDNLAQRAASSGDAADRLQNLIHQPFIYIDAAGVFGYGAASTHQAAPILVASQYSSNSYYWLPPLEFEEETGRIMIELGMVGFVLYMTLKIGVVMMVFRYIHRFGRWVPMAIPITCLLIAVSGLVTGMLFNSVGASFYWGIFGMFLAQANATRLTVRIG